MLNVAQICLCFCNNNNNSPFLQNFKCFAWSYFLQSTIQKGCVYEEFTDGGLILPEIGCNLTCNKTTVVRVV